MNQINAIQKILKKRNSKGLKKEKEYLLNLWDNILASNKKEAQALYTESRKYIQRHDYLKKYPKSNNKPKFYNDKQFDDIDKQYRKWYKDSHGKICSMPLFKSNTRNLIKKYNSDTEDFYYFLRHFSYYYPFNDPEIKLALRLLDEGESIESVYRIFNQSQVIDYKHNWFYKKIKKAIDIAKVLYLNDITFLEPFKELENTILLNDIDNLDRCIYKEDDTVITNLKNTLRIEHGRE